VNDPRVVLVGWLVGDRRQGIGGMRVWQAAMRACSVAHGLVTWSVLLAVSSPRCWVAQAGTARVYNVDHGTLPDSPAGVL
jgi:hypothetical protein